MSSSITKKAVIPSARCVYSAVCSSFTSDSTVVSMSYDDSTEPVAVASSISVTRERTARWLERSGIVIVSARVRRSRKCARLRSLKNSSTAARTTPVVRPVAGSFGSHSWWRCSPFHERRTQKYFGRGRPPPPSSSLRVMRCNRKSITAS